MKLDQLIEPLIAPEDQLKILKDRAVVISREVGEIETRNESIEIVEFILDSEHYGIETSYVEEVYPVKDFTSIPCTPSHIFGIMNVRGKILSVIDLKNYFDLQKKDFNELNKVIIIHDDLTEFGILVDDVLGVVQISNQKIQPCIPTLTGFQSEFLKGITEERLVILDGGRLLSNTNFIVHEET